ncbi:Sensor histidine kinase YpdA [Vibrio aerogenes CECT 7868]|uniref:Sensor histidine kinase YpdA n=1 Tax=Vibrio aerogenes CECT 7868 TaxID=1216006 RepID=A0A1M5X9P3_9VIBR|nr:sensor histidine kinase [Vibrio aerogenes]SHH96288.1 Sensor histidine kinase YpdA [Vibrio aerogenes CECT 7868]
MSMPKHHHSFGRGLLMSTVYCLCVALIFQAFRVTYDTGYSFLYSMPQDLLVSLGFGYGAVCSAHLIIRLKPSLTFNQVNALALICGVSLGSLNTLYWSKDTLHDFFMVILLGLIFSSICFFIFYMYELKQNAQHELEIAKRFQSEQEKALILSQLKQLQSQIEPHFLFNTLANLSVLIDKDPAVAKTLLGKLTDLLRATLKKNRGDRVTLEDELSLIDAYLGIQQIRLGERLHYEIHCDASQHALLLPPMLIQPLAENAIKHGIEPQSRPGKIEVDIEAKNESLLIRVKDNGRGLDPQAESGMIQASGIGLENIRQRLQALYDGQARLTVRENETGGVSAEIALPLSGLTQGV